MLWEVDWEGFFFSHFHIYSETPFPKTFKMTVVTEAGVDETPNKRIKLSEVVAENKRKIKEEKEARLKPLYEEVFGKLLQDLKTKALENCLQEKVIRIRGAVTENKEALKECNLYSDSKALKAEWWRNFKAYAEPRCDIDFDELILHEFDWKDAEVGKHQYAWHLCFMIFITKPNQKTPQPTNLTDTKAE